MDHALYMYYIDDGHNMHRAKRRCGWLGTEIPGYMEHGYGVQRTL